MADVKLSALDPQTGANLVGTDLLYVVDVGASPESRSVTLAELAAAVAAQLQQPDIAAASLATVTGTGDDANINANFAALETVINNIRTALDGAGITA